MVCDLLRNVPQHFQFFLKFLPRIPFFIQLSLQSFDNRLACKSWNWWMLLLTNFFFNLNSTFSLELWFLIGFQHLSFRILNHLRHFHDFIIVELVDKLKNLLSVNICNRFHFWWGRYRLHGLTFRTVALNLAASVLLIFRQGLKILLGQTTFDCLNFFIESTWAFLLTFDLELGRSQISINACYSRFGLQLFVHSG